MLILVSPNMLLTSASVSFSYGCLFEGRNTSSENVLVFDFDLVSPTGDGILSNKKGDEGKIEYDLLV